MRMKKKEEQHWRVMQPSNGSGWPWIRTKKDKQDWRRMVATAQLRLALRLALERRKKEEQERNGFNLDLKWI